MELAKALAQGAAVALVGTDTVARTAVADTLVSAPTWQRSPARSDLEAYLATPTDEDLREAFVRSLMAMLEADEPFLDRVLEALDKVYEIRHLEMHADMRNAPGSVAPADPRPGPAEEEGTVELELAPADESVPPVEESPVYRAYPHLQPKAEDADGGFIMKLNRPFVMEVGLGEQRDFTLTASRGGVGDVRAGTAVTVHLAYDPETLLVEGPSPIVLDLTPDDPFPRIPLRMTARPPADERMVDSRRIAAHYLVDGKLRAVAFRTIPLNRPMTDSPSESLIELDPLAEEDAPDVLVAVYAADGNREGEFTVAAFPRDLDVAPPEVGRISLTTETSAFMERMYREGNRGGDPRDVYDKLAGLGARIGREIPAPIHAMLKRIAEKPGRERSATMLLLTEEAQIPWELAAFPADQRIDSAAGGVSPFLGAHFAIGRWPIVASRVPAPLPDVHTINVRRAALVSANYDGVGSGWLPLPGAVEEVQSLLADYTPAEEWHPIMEEVKQKLFSDVDVIHFALHGRVDDSGVDSGLVLLQQNGDKLRPAYLSADDILGLGTQHPGPLPNRPFVFLNACQVGQGEKLLGDYAGLSSAFLQAGARAVVACLWNVKDSAAGSISREFYQRADAGEAPAEIIRSVRTRYVRPAAWAADAPAAEGGPGPAGGAGAESIPTLIAYQYFGHPGMRVVRAH